MTASVFDPKEQYQFESRLGSGGQGTVYKARDTYLDRFVAIKIVPTHISDDVNNVFREARITNDLRHQNIVDIITAYPDNNATHIVMELLPGSLKDKLDEDKSFDVDTALHITNQVCSAISYAHSKKVFHRDLKPHNILMTDDGTPKVTDFGLSRFTNTQSYKTFGLQGTPEYMAPELFNRNITIDAAGDIYAIGIMLYEMITGELPIKPDQNMTWDRAHREIEVHFPDNLEIPNNIRDIILVALQKDPAKRFSEVSELMARINSEDIDDPEAGDYTQRQVNKWTSTIQSGHAMIVEAHYNRARMLADQGKHDSAIDDYTEVLRLNPQDVNALRDRASSYTSIGNHQLAIDDLSNAIALGSGHHDTYLNRALSYHAMGNYQFAIDDMDEAIRLLAKVEYYQFKSLLHNKIGDYQLAIDDINEVLKLDRDRPDLYAARGNLHVILGNHQTAIDDYSQAIRLDPQFARFYNDRALCHHELTHYQLAIDDFSQAIRIDPENAEPYRGRASCHYLMGNYELAIDDCTKAIRINPEYEYAYNDRGLAHRDMGNHQLAIDDYNEAIRINPENVSHYRARGNSHYLARNYQLAIDDYTQYLSIDPENAEVYNNRGGSRYNMGNYQLAIDDLTQAIRIDPNYAQAYHNRGKTHSASGNYQLAIDDYSNGIQLDPDKSDLYMDRALDHVNLGNHQMAIDDYTQAIGIDRNFADAYFNRGNAHINIGNSQLAIYDYTQVIKINPEHAQSYTSRAETHLGMGNYQLAIDDLTQAIRINPEDVESYTTRAETHLGMGNYQLAIDDCTKTLSANPDNEIFTRIGAMLEEAPVPPKSEGKIKLERLLEFTTQHISDSAALVAYRATICRFHAYTAIGNSQLADVDLKEAVSIRPQADRAYHMKTILSYSRVQKGELNDDHHDMLDSVNKAIVNNPNSGVLYEQRARLNLSGNKTKQAIDDITQALNLGHESSSAFLYRGTAYLGSVINLDNASFLFQSRVIARVIQHNYQLAIDDFTQAIRIDPANVDACLMRAHLHKRMGNYQLAIDDFTHAIRINPEDAEHYGNRGICLIKLGNLELAIDDYNEAIRLDPVAIHYYERGLAQHRLGNKEACRSDYGEAMRIDPEKIGQFFRYTSWQYGIYRMIITIFGLRKAF